MGETKPAISTDVPAEVEDRVPAFNVDGTLTKEVKALGDTDATDAGVIETPVDPEVIEAARDGEVLTSGTDEPKADEQIPAETPVADESATEADAQIPADEQALLEAAQQWGVSEAEARRVGSPEAVKALATMADQRAMEMLAQFQAQQGQQVQQPAVDPQATQQPAPQPAPVPPVPQPVQVPVPSQDDGLNVYREVINSPDDYTALEVQAARDMLAFRQQQAQQVQTSQYAAQQAREAERQQACAEMDQLVDRLGGEWGDFLGKAKTEELAATNPHSFQMERRVALDIALRQVKQLNPNLPRQAIENRALALAFADQLEEVTQRRVAAQAKNRNGQLLNRPSSRAESSPSSAYEDDLREATRKAWHDVQTGKY